MKRIIFLFASLIAFSTTAFATHTTLKTHTFANTNVRGYGNSFIFIEDDIEFSVFADGQFDFYMPNYGPNVRLGINTSFANISFNSGYNYNPYVQYDGFGAIIQIENTPIYYDYYGRVNQVGNIFITYNRFGRIHRIGGLNVYYRNNVFYRYDGFINSYNRSYIYRPWHRFYAVPPANFCIVKVNPYRRFFSPVRHVYYRPYTNNMRFYNINNRRNHLLYGRRNSFNSISDRYVQRPRNARERTIQRRAKKNNVIRSKTRKSRLNTNRTVRNKTSRNKSITNRGLKKQHTRTKKNVTTTRHAVPKRIETRSNSVVKNPRLRNSRINNTSQNKRQPSSKTVRSSSRTQKSMRSGSRR